MSNEGPRIYDGRQWVTVAGSANDATVTPVKQVVDGDGKIFVSIASYRDGERCGETIKALFANAAEPDNIIIGLAEQNAPEDKFCLESYCKLYGVQSIRRDMIRKDTTKILVLPAARTKCPRYDQVRQISYHHVQARGPTYSRSLVRKVLGNEEFCMQIDAHTDVAKGWDHMAKEEWGWTQNEFGVLSNVPADTMDKPSMVEGAKDFRAVPRQCAVRFLDNGFPDYLSPADGKLVDLEKPLLGHGWSAAFSFAKCHLEESAPYDNFSVYAKPLEQVSRYARMWTRGYDVYTPSRNLVFHDYAMQSNGHGNNEWFGRQRDRFRKSSIARAKTLLQLPGGDPDTNDMGIYGLGKRRSLEQLQDFMNINLLSKRGNLGGNLICAGHQWVPYDTAISPTDNLETDTDHHRDPQPEYPLRTNLVYYEQVEIKEAKNPLIVNNSPLEDSRMLAHDNGPAGADGVGANLPPISLLCIVWIFGLFVWYIMFGGSAGFSGGDPTTQRRKKATRGVKDV